MIKYAVFAFIFILLIINFFIKSIARHFMKKELNEVQEVAAKSVCFLLVILGVVYIIFFG